jgi:hypothetical protein
LNPKDYLFLLQKVSKRSDMTLGLKILLISASSLRLPLGIPYWSLGQLIIYRLSAIFTIIPRVFPFSLPEGWFTFVIINKK